ncbi:NAD(P)-binding protein [Pararhizobium sp.]|uniref:NAD(P)-binding protein n=1 Tax=Pararhizobium sp. TaxID=1977563 RepID=UPI00271ADE94|nr:NAD(P)-binding protein [Pararhizobium sp.]MDO9418444.1 NAD(P)-binding protein [Pararhizobium sp.]
MVSRRGRVQAIWEYSGTGSYIMAQQGIRKIAIIGGGVGSITAAYALTEEPDWQTKYEITVYQLGWRLGGKGASGRNRQKANRIEEHGLHIWAGFYDNAFRLMRSCYEGLVKSGLRTPDDPLGTMAKAFKPLNTFVLSEEAPAGIAQEWRPWLIEFPGNDGVPGTGGLLPQPFDYFQMMLEFLASQAEILDRVQPKQQVRSAGGFAAPYHGLLARAKTMPSDARLHTARHRSDLLELLAGIRLWLGGIRPDEWINNDVERRIYFMLDLGTAFAAGMVADRVFTRGFDSIDGMECSAWLLKHGASQQAVDSAVFRGCYDYVFGYPGGICTDRGVGAGTAMRGLLRLAFTYKGALFYKMQAGMGDTIFAPYYQVLKQRGVTFHFFHAVTRLTLSPLKDAIAGIELVEQARTVSGGAYEPLFDVAGLPCWPSEPDWPQLVDGEKLKASGIDFESEKTYPPAGIPKTLVRGVDFDDIVLGASMGSLAPMTQELSTASPRWKQMLENVQTVATCAAQFWMTIPASKTGWPALIKAHNDTGSIDLDTLQTVMTGFAEPLDTWADMSDLLPRETWPDPAPASIAYFCSPSRDADVPAPSMRDQAGQWSDGYLTRIWPETRNGDGSFNRDLLVSIDGQSAQARFDDQYFRQNFYGSERYVLSVPGSVNHRLAPDESGFTNLVLAGDWTRCGINAGCVEAATISGLGAARVFTGSTALIYGEFDMVPSTPALLSSIAAPQANWPLTPAFLRGSMEGVFSFHALPKEDVRTMLPQGLVLSKQSLTPAGTHPVTFLFNRQTNVCPSFLPQFLGFKSYLESIVAINCVEMNGGDGTIFSFLPALFLDNRLATFSGRFFYGLAKHFAKNEMTASTYRTATQQNAPVWAMQFFDCSPACRLVELGNIGLVRALLDTPILTPRGTASWQAMAFDFSVGSAFAAPVSTQIDIFATNGIGLPAGRLISPPFRPDPEETGLPGAFRCWTSWTLSNPFDSSRVKDVAAAQQMLDFSWWQT